MKKLIVIEMISALVITLFVYAALSKILSYDKFVTQISQSPMLTNIAGFVAWFIPASEMICSLLLIFTRSRLIGLYFSFALMLGFSVYIFLIINYSENVPCSCGGVLEKLGWTQHLYFNLVFVVLLGFAIIISSSVNVRSSDESITSKIS